MDSQINQALVFLICVFLVTFLLLLHIGVSAGPAFILADIAAVGTFLFFCILRYRDTK